MPRQTPVQSVEPDKGELQVQFEQVNPSAAAPVLVLAVERLSELVAGRLLRPLIVERFQVRLSLMDDLPLYLAARAVLRRTGARRMRGWVVRMIEPPPDIESSMEDKTPQFFLRNVLRAERPEDEEFFFEVVPTRDRKEERLPGQSGGLRYRPPRLLTRWNIDEVSWLRAMLKKLLYQEDWRRRFGKELKETVRGPLFLYDPDRPNDDPSAAET